MSDQPIHVTEPFLPPIEEYLTYLEGIWERNWLTNNGPLLREFEQKLKAYHNLEIPVHAVANGGLGLQITLKALGVGGEVVTTPFSYVATSSCPLWEGCQVRFADIDAEFLTLAPDAVEAAITPKTEAIVATHVFGNPCDCEALEDIAKRHGLALVFDAAHAFGVEYKGRSLLSYGDASMVSLHATKLMHSVEGGLVVCKDPQVAEKVEWMRRFGHEGFEGFHGVGINAKMSEFHAAMGLCVLKHIEKILQRRELLTKAYGAALSSLQPHCRQLKWRPQSSCNYAYFPVLFESEVFCRAAQEALVDCNIFARRYFYPLLDCITGNRASDCATASDVSVRILCLPLSESMPSSQVEEVCSVIGKAVP